VPTALFRGSLDDLAPPKDTEWLAEQMKNTLVFNNQYRMGHISPQIGIDMSWFKLDAMYLVEKYHPLDGSLFTGEYEYINQ
jgi:hypothetical protein